MSSNASEQVTFNSKSGGGSSKLGQFSMKAHLPYMKLNVPLALTSSEIFEVFSYVSKNKSFQIIEMESNLATAVNKEPFSLKRLFLRCLPFSTEAKKEKKHTTLLSLANHLNFLKHELCLSEHKSKTLF